MKATYKDIANQIKQAAEQKAKELSKESSSNATVDPLAKKMDDEAQKVSQPKTDKEVKDGLPASSSTEDAPANSDKGADQFEASMGAMEISDKSKTHDGPKDGEAEDKSDTSKLKSDLKSPSLKSAEDIKKKASAILDRLGKAGKKDLRGVEDGEFKEKLASEKREDVTGYEKLAQALLSDEETFKQACDLIEAQKGKEAARRMIDDAIASRDAYIEEVYKQAAVAQYQNSLAEQIEEFNKTASAEDKELAVKYANVHAKGASKFESELEKYAYAGGAADAAAMMDAGMEEGGEPTLPGAGEEISPEDILAVLEMLVQAGQLDPQTAEALAMELLGGGEAAPAEAGLEEDPTAGEAPVEEGGEKLAAYMKAYKQKANTSSSAEDPADKEYPATPGSKSASAEKQAKSKYAELASKLKAKPSAKSE